MSYKNETQNDKQNFSCEIREHIGVMSESGQGWTKELNIVSWSGRPAKFDIREWSKDHARMSRGITFSLSEVAQLKGLLKDLDLEKYETETAAPAMAEDPDEPYSVREDPDEPYSVREDPDEPCSVRGDAEVSY